MKYDLEIGQEVILVDTYNEFRKTSIGKVVKKGNKFYHIEESPGHSRTMKMEIGDNKILNAGYTPHVFVYPSLEEYERISIRSRRQNDIHSRMISCGCFVLAELSDEDLSTLERILKINPSED